MAEFWECGPPEDYWEHVTPRAMSREEAEAQTIIYEPGEGRRGRGGNKPMQRKFTRLKKKRIVAYDTETTNIQVGTPELLYITAYANPENPKHKVNISKAIPGKDLATRQRACLDILETYFLIPENNRVRFVSWNGNRYDTLLLAQCLMLSPDWELAPYMTRAKTVRGLKVIGRNSKAKLEFEFLDGMAMTGLDTVSMPLKKFLGLFAPPEYQKLSDAIDFEHETFDPNNKKHVEYAERDSAGLWYAIMACNEIMEKLTGNELQPTMGRAAVHYFMSEMPENVRVYPPQPELFDILHDKAKRGGYVWLQKQFKGKVWKYDINQAYAGAMRDCNLPSGTAINCGPHYQREWPGVYRCKISRTDPSPIPFYYRDSETEAAGFANGKTVTDTWIMSNEVQHLLEDGWNIEFVDGWYWEEKWNWKDAVDKCEAVRYTDPGGPSGPLGTMIKQVGNSGYGKLLERLDGVSYVFAAKQPEGYVQWHSDTVDKQSPIYMKQEEPFRALYHQPQLGCFITAHVRIQLRAAALTMPHAFVYGDTDGAAFTEPNPYLAIDAKKYGLWKTECEGLEYIFIGKKVYCGTEDGVRHAKGLRIKELETKDFEYWLRGTIPKQVQLQRNNFMKMATGEPMFRNLTRTGTNVRKLKSVRFDGENFSPH